MHPRHGGGCTPGSVQGVWPSISGDSHMPVSRVIPARVATPSFLPEFSQPWLLGRFGVRMQPSQIRAWEMCSCKGSLGKYFRLCRPHGLSFVVAQKQPHITYK